MPSFTALYDACVLYPAPLRDLLMQLAVAELYNARWTDRIHDEWISNLLKNRIDLTADMLHRTRTLMNSNVRDCLVEGYEPLIDSLNLPDADDRHVLAAAIRCHADVIVTANEKDFPAKYLSQFGIEALHPDDFLVYQFDLATGDVCAAVQKVRKRLKSPPKTVDELLETYSKNGLVAFVEKLKPFRPLL